MTIMPLLDSMSRLSSVFTPSILSMYPVIGPFCVWGSGGSHEICTAVELRASTRRLLGAPLGTVVIKESYTNL